MLNSLTVPILVVLLGLPGIGGILKGFRVKHGTQASFVDSLPPQWKPASRLALENRFVRAGLPPLGRGPVSLKLPADPRRLRVSIDLDSAMVSTVPEFGEVALGAGAERSLTRYNQQLTSENFERLWEERSRQNVNSLGANTPSTSSTPGLSFKLPSPLPRRVQSWLGPGGPALNVSGSENIRLSGQSNWTNQQTGPLGQKKSLFPSLDMQQDLDIKLEGQLSDRVRVNLLQNSGIQIPLANRIAINYKGDEDDLVQQLDLGNTNLSLPGTQYVSYSGKNEGLFGVKATTRLGPLDFSILTSKQEGRSERASYAGGASKQSQTIRDLEYIRGVYFFLYDPNGTAYEIDESSIRVYLDDDNSYNDINTVRGRALVDPVGPDSVAADSLHGQFSVRGTFSQLNPGADQDYEILSGEDDLYGPNYRVIRVRRPMNPQLSQTLAVTYQRRPAGSTEPFTQVGGTDTLDVDGSQIRTMKILWAPPRLMKSGTSDFFDPNLTLTITRDLELRNFYQLGGQSIDLASLKISIRKGVDQPPIVNLSTTSGLTVPYIEALGLDNFDETSGTPVRGHDAKVDVAPLTANTRVFVDPKEGTLFFYEVRPFDPRIGSRSDAKPFEQKLAADLTRRASLIDVSDGPNREIYDKYVIQRDVDARYYIDVEFNAARAGGEINLGRSNIVEGSDVVTINNIPLVRDREYEIDYDLGRVILKRQLGPADNLNIDYSYAPLFAQAGRTLIGSAFRVEGRERSLGGAFMYESKGAQDLRPRLGEEPSRSLIGDLNTDWAFHPDWMTRLVDKLPGIRTATGSEFRLQAEAGASFPNPNTRGVVYIDDMEGVRDAVSLSMGPDRWRWASVPSRATGFDSQGNVTGARKLVDPANGTLPFPMHNAEVHWYSPYSVVKERDLKPTLTDAEGAQNSRQVLALSVPRRPLTARPGDSLWVGLTYPLDPNGLDLSRSQFIELWVNDFNDLTRIRNPHVRLHIDLGAVSEDQMRSPDASPNRRLDTEDRERDNQLVVTEGKTEDTGLDGWLLQAERDSIPLQGSPPFYRDLVTSDSNDPQGDDFDQPDDRYKEIDPRRYVRTNGLEDNKTILPYPDTEDLSANNILDTDEGYLEFTIDLGDTTYLVSDLQREFPTLVNGDNGWRRYRIPITDPGRLQFGVTDLNFTRHVRVWLEGLIEPNPDPTPTSDGNGLQRPLLMFGGLEIVGSRWRLVDPDSSSLAAGTTATLNSVNTIDNADIYRAPFDPGETRSGNQGLKRREQSIALEFTEIQPDSAVEAFKTFSLDENYSRYGSLNWFVTGFDVEDELGGRDGAGLQYFVRFASDERGLNYYEYRAPLPVAAEFRGINWREVKLQLSELSGLKLNPDFPAGVVQVNGEIQPIYYARPRSAGSPETLIVKGRPSFTRLRRISFGLINQSGTRAFRSGQMWFNELRATEVAKDRGQAERVLVNGNLANLLRYNVSWNGRDADFLSVGESRGMGSSSSDLALGTTIDLHRFFERTGIVLPVSFNFVQRNSEPRFSAGDDVVRTGAQAQASETFSDNRNWQASYQRSWSERSNPLLRYTLGGLSADVRGSNSHDHNPNNLASGDQFAAQVNYQIAPRNLFNIKLPGTKAKFYPFPERVFWNYGLNNSASRVFDRALSGDALIARAPVIGRQASVRFGADSRPFDVFQHSFSAERNLRLEDRLLEKVGFINFGRVVHWTQSMSTRYGMNFGQWVRPSMSWRSSYDQENGPQLSQDLSLRAIHNTQAVNVSWSLPFDGLATRPAARALPKLAGAPAVPGADSATVAPPTPKEPGIPVWRNVLSRVGNINTDATVNWTSGYSRLTGTPGLPYLIGFSGNPEKGGNGVQRAFGNSTDRGFNWDADAHTRITLAYGASMTTTAKFGSQVTNRNDVEVRKDNVRFPDFQVEYGRIANLMQLDHVLLNPRLKTIYNRQKLSDFTNGESNGTSISTQWQPLLGIEGDLKNGARLQLSIEHRSTIRVIEQLGRSTATDRNTDINFGLNRSYSQGQKVKFLGKESTVKSTVNLGLSAAYSRRTGETVRFGREDEPLFPTKTDRLSVNGTGSYGFSNNVTGNLNLGFVQTRDIVREIVTRSIRVELAARFSF